MAHGPRSLEHHKLWKALALRWRHPGQITALPRRVAAVFRRLPPR
jgi:hypothetical protein